MIDGCLQPLSQCPLDRQDTQTCGYRSGYRSSTGRGRSYQCFPDLESPCTDFVPEPLTPSFANTGPRHGDWIPRRGPELPRNGGDRAPSGRDPSDHTTALRCAVGIRGRQCTARRGGRGKVLTAQPNQCAHTRLSTSEGGKTVHHGLSKPRAHGARNRRTR